jgi:hypothetical protein
MRRADPDFRSEIESDRLIATGLSPSAAKRPRGALSANKPNLV